MFFYQVIFLAVLFTVMFTEAAPTFCDCICHDKSGNATQEEKEVSKLETLLKFRIGSKTTLKYQGLKQPNILLI